MECQHSVVQPGRVGAAGSWVARSLWGGGAGALTLALSACGGGTDVAQSTADATPPSSLQAQAVQDEALSLRAAALQVEHDALGEADALGTPNEVGASPNKTGKILTVPVLSTQATAVADFLPTVFNPEPPTLQSTCGPASVVRSKATLARVWFAQTHLMETSWPLFNLVQGRGALLKADIWGAAGTPIPQVKVTASWPGGSETRCMVAPASLPTSVDTRVQPTQQSLATSFRMTLPSSWMRPDMTLKISVGNGPSRTFLPAELKLKTRPQMEMVLADALLFGDTTVRNSDAMRAEFAARFPFSSVAFYKFPQPLSLPRLVVGPRSDGRSATGVDGDQPAVWADRLPSCTAAQATAGTCTRYRGFGVLSATYSLARELKNANAMGWTGTWYVGHGAQSGVGGGLGGGQQGSGDNYALIFNHEIGHALSLPHMGDVTGSKQTSSTGLRHPYTGDSANGSTFRGGGFGKSTGYDPLDNTLMHWGCNGTQTEAQDPMQRDCNNIASGRVFDHFSDFSALQMQRYWTGAAAPLSGTVPYWSSYVSGSSAGAPVATPFYLPSQGGTVQAEWAPGATTPVLKRYNTSTGLYETVLRPPGDDGFVKALPTAPAGSAYDAYYDFRFPQQFNVPVVTVLGSFNYTDDATSAVLGVIQTKGHLKRLWDPTDPTTFDLIKRSISGNTFWWGYNLHLKVEYADGSTRHVAIDKDVEATTNPMSGFTYWAVNLPDDGRAISRITLMHRPLCVRNGAASDRSCDISVAANGITAANVYNAAKIATTWVP